MGLSLKDRVEIPDTVTSRHLDDEVVILNLESFTFFGLDPVGTRIWTLLKEHGSIGSVLEIMEQEYDADAVQLQDELLRLTAELCDEGLIRVVSANISKPPIK